jgi:hypothetical protein
MNNSTINCPKCKGNMVGGFIPDVTYGGFIVTGWHEGDPKKSFWMRTKVSLEDCVPIRAFRCSGCGFLELYADKKFGAQ